MNSFSWTLSLVLITLPCRNTPTPSCSIVFIPYINRHASSDSMLAYSAIWHIPSGLDSSPNAPGSLHRRQSDRFRVILGIANQIHERISFIYGDNIVFATWRLSSRIIHYGQPPRQCSHSKTWKHPAGALYKHEYCGISCCTDEWDRIYFDRPQIYRVSRVLPGAASLEPLASRSSTDKTIAFTLGVRFQGLPAAFQSEAGWEWTGRAFFFKKNSGSCFAKLKFHRGLDVNCQYQLSAGYCFDWTSCLEQLASRFGTGLFTKRFVWPTFDIIVEMLFYEHVSVSSNLYCQIDWTVCTLKIAQQIDWWPPSFFP